MSITRAKAEEIIYLYDRIDRFYQEEIFLKLLKAFDVEHMKWDGILKIFIEENGEQHIIRSKE